jgi:hypothetical protein
MTRSRQSAKQAGTTFERQIADYLASALNDDRIDRRIKTGNKDRGDITGIQIHGQRLVIECKNSPTNIDLPGWIREAHTEAGNDDAITGIIIHKRKGKTYTGDQWVTMTVADLCSLITGNPRLDIGIT